MTITDSLGPAVVSRLLANLHGARIDLVDPRGRIRRFGDTTQTPITVELHDPHAIGHLLRRPRLGLGETYVAGAWDTDDLAGLLEVLHHHATTSASAGAAKGIHTIQEAAAGFRVPRRDHANRERARRDIAFHYDLGNEFYELFLDRTMSYSSAYVTDADFSLEDAQLAKYARLAAKAQLHAADHLLEIGCGWGGFAVWAAENFGCRVTAVTLSAAQALAARKRAANAGVGDLVDVVECDYRDLRGSYSKIVSVEMVEAVGHDLATFFARCDDLLAPDGLFVAQIIVKPDQRARRTRRLDNGWIETYIFPGSLIPSVTEIALAATDHSGLLMHHLEEIGAGYGPTLAEWRRRFEQAEPSVRALGFDDEFLRTWRFYLAMAEAGFRARYLRDVQLVFTRPGNTTLPAHARRTWSF